MIENPISVPYRNRPFVSMLSLDLVDALPFAPWLVVSAFLAASKLHKDELKFNF